MIQRYNRVLAHISAEIRELGWLGVRSIRTTRSTYFIWCVSKRPCRDETILFMKRHIHVGASVVIRESALPGGPRIQMAAILESM